MLALMEREREFLVHQDFPKAKFYPRRDCGRDHHLWCNLDLQLNHFRCWPEDKQQLLRHAYKRVNYDLADGTPGFWKRQKEWKNYDATASIIALSRYEHRSDFLRCGYYKYSCHDPLCPRCAYNEIAEPALREFGDSYTADTECYYLVLSLSREPEETKRLIFRDLTKSEMQQIKRRGQFEQGSLDNYGLPFVDPEHVLDTHIYWELYANVIHQLTNRRMRRGRLFSGAFGGPELSVRFAPLAVLPHANYVVWSPGISADDVREVRRLARRKLRGCRRIKPGLYPHVAVYRILSRQDLESVIEYVFKPIALAQAYALTAFNAKCEARKLKQLNEQVNVFLENLEFAFHGLHRINRYGFCSPSSGDANYIGAVTPERQARRIVDAVRRAKRKAEDRKLKRHFPGYQPHKRKKTQKQRDEAVLDRAYLRRMMRDGETAGK